MKWILMLFIMLALHVLADFHLQGILARMKQKNWWIKQVKDLKNSIYRNDYKVALAAHCFEWSFLVLLPCLVCKWSDICSETGWAAIRPMLLYVPLLLANTFYHYAADDLKANEGENGINLVNDQLLHIIQICVSWILWTIFVGW